MKMKALKSVILPAIAVLLGSFAIHLHMGKKQSMMRYQAYLQVSMGDTFKQLVDAYGREPDSIIKVASIDASVAYYFGRGKRGSFTFESASVEHLSEIPCPYDAMQFLVQNDVVIAKAWCGEDNWIQSTSGPVKGSCLTQLVLNNGGR